MGCCAGTGGDAEEQERRVRREDLRASAQRGEDGRPRLILSAPAIRCGQCIAAIESALPRLPEVASARVNLTLRRISVTLAAPDSDPVPVGETLAALGYPATAVEPGTPASEGSDAAGLVRAMAVAGFGASNVMLMSVAVWSGAGEGLREAFHLLSAAIALPVVAYAGRPFFASAWTGMRAGRLNMDVPISLGVLLTLGLSLFELVQGGRHVFFDAAVMLVFFLLVGRYLDALMRERARSAVTGLARLAARGGTVIGEDGATRYLPLEDIRPGMTLRVLPGDRVPVDIRILHGGTDLDRSIVTGESAPAPAGPGDVLEAGSLNLTGAVEAEVLRPAGESFLAEVTRMLEAAEHGRGRYVRVADRAARLYAPVVHTLAAAAFAGWIFATGDLHGAIFVAVSVLIITCPCALGLAVPVVHVVASGRLFQAGIMIRDGSALERLATIDRAVFDKTGTLTIGTPQVAVDAIAARDRGAVAALARQSAHPVSRALAAILPEAAVGLAAARERPGYGIEARVDGRPARLGRAAWVAEIASGPPPAPGTAFAYAGAPAAPIALGETLRPAAEETVTALRQAGIAVEVLSGDAAAAVEGIARQAGIAEWTAERTPADKVRHIEARAAGDGRVLMVGDGLNDAAALAAAHVSMAPASASDAGRMAADIVFTRDRLDAVALAHRTARRAAALVRQNLALTVLYNCIAVPIAMAGFVTPLMAAVAMSASSILVVGNALRLKGPDAAPREGRPSEPFGRQGEYA